MIQKIIVKLLRFTKHTTTFTKHTANKIENLSIEKEIDSEGKVK